MNLFFKLHHHVFFMPLGRDVAILLLSAQTGFLRQVTCSLILPSLN